MKNLGFSRLGSKSTVRVPDEVIKKLNLETDSPVVFFHDPKKDGIVVMKKGRVVEDEE